jgi:hypothetical protein
MDVVYDAIIGAVNLRQVKKTSFKGNVQAQSLRVSGGVDPSAMYVVSGEPRATFETMDIAGAIVGLSIQSGLNVAAGTLTIPWNRRANGGTFAGGANNFTLTGANGLAVINSIGASQGDEGAVAEIELCFLSTDGLTSPIAANVNQTLASQAYNAAYAMGPFYLNGSQLSQVVSVKVNTGIKLTLKRYDGSVYPTIAFIETRDPTIDITFENADAISAQGPLFSAMTSAAVYFRKKSDGGTFVADATAVHAKLSFATGLTEIQGIDGDGNSNGSATLRLVGKQLSATSTVAIGS